MVKRQEANVLTEFEGVVRTVEFQANESTGVRQYHIEIEPTSIQVSGKTGKFHEWIPLSPKASENSVPAGSVLDRYLQMVEALIPGADKKDTVEAALGTMKGKKFRFKKMKLGRDYDGYKAKEYSTPVALLN